MKPSDLDLLNSVSEPSLSPDGTHAVVSVQRPDFAADSYVGQLWSVSTGRVGTAAADPRLQRLLTPVLPGRVPDRFPALGTRCSPPALRHACRGRGAGPAH